MFANGQYFLSFLAEKPEISHFYCARPLAFNRVVHNACSGSIVHMDGGWRLWVSHFGETNDFGFLSVEKQRTECCIHGGYFDKFQDSTSNIRVSVEPDRFPVARQASKEEISACA